MYSVVSAIETILLQRIWWRNTEPQSALGPLSFAREMPSLEDLTVNGLDVVFDEGDNDAIVPCYSTW